MPRNDQKERELSDLRGEELTRYIQNCVQLAQGNKISIKNAFDIKLIDQMMTVARESTRKNDEGECSTNFPFVSVSLSASAKVYGYRVDTVHQEATRLRHELPVQKKQTAVEENAREPEFAESTRVRRRRILSSYLAEDGANDKPLDVDHDLCRNPVMAAVNGNNDNRMGRLMSYNLVPPETEAIDLEGDLPWLPTTCLERITTRECIHVRENLPVCVSQPIICDFKEEEEFPGGHSQVSDRNADLQSVLEDIAPVEVIGEEDAIEFNPDADPEPVVEDTEPVDLVEDDDDDTEFDDVRIEAPGDFSALYNHHFSVTGKNFPWASNFRTKRYDILGRERDSRRRKEKPEPKYLSLSDLPADIDDVVVP